MAVLEVKNLSKQYKDFKAINNVSFEATQGSIFGLLGPNGAGKTTTIRVIATMLAPTAGSVVVKGFDIQQQPQEVRKNIGVLTTEIGIYSRFTGRENLEYYGQLYNLQPHVLKKRVAELTNLLDMGEFIDRKSGEYSTGMKQKLAIARSVIHDPEVIIFDEPTSGLDVLASQTVLNFMRESKRLGKCVIFSTHQMPDAERLCDSLVIIHRGKVVINDTLPNIKSVANVENLEDAFLKLVKK
jgi:sodium transport system ATP-binding protein